MKKLLITVTTILTTLHSLQTNAQQHFTEISCYSSSPSEDKYRVRLLPVGAGFAQVYLERPNSLGKWTSQEGPIGAEVTYGQTGDGYLLSISGIPNQEDSDRHFLIVLIKDPPEETSNGAKLPLYYIRGELENLRFTGAEELKCIEKSSSLETVTGTSQVTYARFVEERSIVLSQLKNSVDVDAADQCKKQGFLSAIRTDEYEHTEQHHGGFAYLSTIKMRARYLCLSAS